ncbi:hypothetical protein AcidC75_17590 [Acidisoma sp. C75]
MRAEGEAGAADAADPAAGGELPLAIRDARRDHAEMGVESLEAWVLDQNFQPAHARAVDPDDAPGRHRQHRRPCRRSKIDPPMIPPGDRGGGDDARPEG